MRIAIQGILGSFHEIATRQYYDDAEITDIIQCSTFNELFESIECNRADIGIVAVENSVAGSILSNYALLRRSGLNIMGEIYLRIEQNLLGLASQDMINIREIHSHPMAIQQCYRFLDPLRRKGIKLVDSEDTALSAKRIAEGHLANTAAIASSPAAEIYGLRILSKGIETNKRNYTRFLVVATNAIYEQRVINKKISKSSIVFNLPNEEGSLSSVLSVLSFHKINLTMIQSLPIVGREWEYRFYTDMLIDDYKKYQSALDAIKALTIDLNILGEYERAERPMENKIPINELETA